VRNVKISYQEFIHRIGGKEVLGRVVGIWEGLIVFYTSLVE
jgi:hypothetical protein